MVTFIVYFKTGAKVAIKANGCILMPAFEWFSKQ